MLLQAAFLAMFFASTVEVVLVYERMRGHARFYLADSLVTLYLSLAPNILFIGGLDAGMWGFVSSKLITSIGALASWPGGCGGRGAGIGAAPMCRCSFGSGRR